ncbi:MAG: histidinol-phosphate transaminase [Bacteroidota bacterium]
MGKVEISALIRPHLIDMKPYASARDEFTGKSEVYLDANENSLGSVGVRDLSRYPDPHQHEIKKKLSSLKQIAADQIFIGNGSDEPIDLLIRAFCEPLKNEIIILPPTYGMYEVSANVNNVPVKKVPLTADFQLDVAAIEEAINSHTKLIFTCNPNNPTGTRIADTEVIKILENFNGLVIVDEAYIDFSEKESFIGLIEQYNNLVVLQTFSKAWGLAAARVGMLYGSTEVVEILNKIKPPYNVNEMSQEAVIYALQNEQQKQAFVDEILNERAYLHTELASLTTVQSIYPSDTNFLLVRVTEPDKLYHYLIDKGIIVRNRSKVLLCEGCLRITVGTRQENERLIKAIKSF